METAQEAPLSSPQTPPVFVYMILMANGAYYTGWTTDIKRRFKEHREGPKGARFTKAFGAKSIAAAWEIHGTRSDALRIESFIKKISRLEKTKLVDNPSSLGKLLKKNSNYDFNKEIMPVTFLATGNAG